jgi:hypothetical protein
VASPAVPRQGVEFLELTRFRGGIRLPDPVSPYRSQ